MQITNLRPVDHGGPGPTVTVASFTVQVTPDVTLNNVQLRRKPDGSYRIQPPRAFGEPSAFFTGPLARKLAEAATIEFERQCARDITSR